MSDQPQPTPLQDVITFILNNHGAFAVYGGFLWWDSDGQMHTAVHHANAPYQHGKFGVPPSLFNIPAGSVLCFRAGIEAGGKEVAKEAFTYNPDADAAPEYKTTGTTSSSHMKYEGIKAPIPPD